MGIAIVAANWKMNKTCAEAGEFCEELKERVKDFYHLEMVICPPFTALAKVAEALKQGNIKWGAQNLYFQKSGAYTGEISPLMLRDLGCHYVIIGHSERRSIFKESDEEINKKIKIAFEFNLTPIFCLGETLPQREKGQTLKIIERQVREGLKDIPSEKINELIIAYEPVWAIGTGKTARTEDVRVVHHYIRSLLNTIFAQGTGERVRVQYGGSVTPDNIEELIREKEIDGALVGGAGLDISKFVKILASVNKERGG